MVKIRKSKINLVIIDDIKGMVKEANFKILY